MQIKDDDYELIVRLSKTEKRLTFVEQLAGIGYVEIDLKARRIYISNSVLRMLEYDNASIEHSELKQVVTYEEYRRIVRKINKIYRRKEALNGQITLKTQNGKQKYCLWHAAYFCHQKQEIIAGTIQDLSELISANQKLKEATQQAEKLNKDKSLFLAQASHDLRQPMMALGLYISSFPIEGLTPHQCLIFNKISLSAENLQSLLNNFLDLSKLDYGLTELAPSMVNVGILLSNLGKEFADLAQAQNLNFEYSICNCCIYNDTFLLERMLRNILSNAFKFARQQVGMYCRETKENIILEIKDDGQGMTKKEQARIFEEFYRGSNARRNNIDGVGLGLAIVQKIAIIIKAQIKVDSQKNKGSIFTITLPKEI